MAKKLYSREDAEAILGATGENRWRFEDNGLWPDIEHAWAKSQGLIPEYNEQRWVPATALIGTEYEVNVASTPALPFPFDERDLAAFMLSGLGYFVAEFYGGLGSAVDEDALDSIVPAQNYARRAVHGAFVAYREAAERVGQPNRELALRMQEAYKAYREEREASMQRHCLGEVPQPKSNDSDERRSELSAEYQRRLALVEAEVSALKAEMNRLQDESASAEQTWLSAMVTELLKPATNTTTEPQPEPQAEHVKRNEAATAKTKAKRITWLDVSSAYIAEVIQAGQYGTAKELYRALEAKAGPNSPFDKGDGANRGSLFVRETAQSLRLKTVQNNFPKLRALAQKVMP